MRIDARAESDGSVRILAGAGDDSLFGGANADILYGGLGADSMDGGEGADTYLYRSAAESTAASRDTLTFTAGDRIDLSAIDADATSPGVNDAFAFIGSGLFGNHAGELRAFQSAGVWTIEGDVNGDGVADLVITVTGAATIGAGDFVP
jgi:serralysin